MWIPPRHLPTKSWPHPTLQRKSGCSSRLLDFFFMRAAPCCRPPPQFPAFAGLCGTQKRTDSPVMGFWEKCLLCYQAVQFIVLSPFGMKKASAALLHHLWCCTMGLFQNVHFSTPFWIVHRKVSNAADFHTVRPLVHQLCRVQTD